MSVYVAIVYVYTYIYIYIYLFVYRTQVESWNVAHFFNLTNSSGVFVHFPGARRLDVQPMLPWKKRTAAQSRSPMMSTMTCHVFEVLKNVSCQENDNFAVANVLPTQQICYAA